MSYCKKVQCIKCGMKMEGEFYDPCPYCKAEGYNMNYNTVFDLKNARLPSKKSGRGIYKYRDFFAMDEKEPEVSIGEGNTPFYRLSRMGRRLGLEYLYMKDESKNPTLSHKDRMCSIIVSKALAKGAPGVAISSTGNQGISTAAYCAAANLPCIIFTSPYVSKSMKVAMQSYGAFVIEAETPEDRNFLLEKAVREWGFIPAGGLTRPPMGSSCFGIDGYKTIAYEIYEQMNGQVPGWMIVPFFYGDTLYGIYKGMCELKEMRYIERIPRMVAAESFGAAKAAQTSGATGYATYQAVMAVRKSRGAAIGSSDEEAIDMQAEFAKTEGVFAETASATSLVALEKLIGEGEIKPREKVVVLITSAGIKDPETAALNFEAVPRIGATMEELEAALRDSYGFTFPSGW